MPKDILQVGPLQRGWISIDRPEIICAGGLPGCGHIAAELRDELLNGEIFYGLKEAQTVIEQWRKHYNTIRPHSALNYRPPAPQTFAPLARHLDEIMPMQ